MNVLMFVMDISDASRNRGLFVNMNQNSYLLILENKKMVC